MWITKLADPPLEDGAAAGAEEAPLSFDDELSLGLNGLFDRMSTYGSRLVEAANEHVLRGHIANILAPDPPSMPVDPPKPRRRITIGVMGSSTEEHAHLAEPLGYWIAQSGFNLLTGGGSGVMCSASRAFVSAYERRGSCIGVIPCSEHDVSPRPGYPNAFVEVPVYTHMPLVPGLDMRSRNHINILSSDIVIVLPGSHGTYSELQLALRYGKKVIVFLGTSAADGSDATVVGMKEGEAPIVRCLEDVKAFVLGTLHKMDPDLVAGPGPVLAAQTDEAARHSRGTSTVAVQTQQPPQAAQAQAPSRHMKTLKHMRSTGVQDRLARRLSSVQGYAQAADTDLDDFEMITYGDL